MAQIISVHSFRRGIGKSSFIANISSLLAMQGYQVGVIDTSIRSPTLQVLFGLDEAKIKYSFNDYLWGNCELTQTIHDVTNHIHPGLSLDGQVFLIPASSRLRDITRVMNEGYNLDRLHTAFYKIGELLDLDILLLDTYAGLSDSSLSALAVSDTSIIVLRLDEQNYHGTGIMVDLAREFKVGNIAIVVNEVPYTFEPNEVIAKVEETYRCPVLALLPYSDEMMALASTSIFAFQYPKHTVTLALKEIAHVLMVSNEKLVDKK